MIYIRNIYQTKCSKFCNMNYIWTPKQSESKSAHCGAHIHDFHLHKIQTQTNPFTFCIRNFKLLNCWLVCILKSNTRFRTYFVCTNRFVDARNNVLKYLEFVCVSSTHTIHSSVRICSQPDSLTFETLCCLQNNNRKDVVCLQSASNSMHPNE